jgi:protein PsiE
MVVRRPKLIALVARAERQNLSERATKGQRMTDQKNPAKTLDQRMLSFADPIGRFLTDGFHILALFAIGGATVWAAAAAFYAMVQKGSATIEDLLLLFIYLEIGSMVGIYFRTNHMPVRFLLYVGITALTRHLIGFVQHEEIADIGVLVLAGAILILAFAVFVIRFASNRFPAPTDGEVARGEVGRSEVRDE